MCNREISSRRIDWFFREALRPSGADPQGGSYQPPPPPPPLAKVAKYGKRVRNRGYRDPELPGPALVGPAAGRTADRRPPAAARPGGAGRAGALLAAAAQLPRPAHRAAGYATGARDGGHDLPAERQLVVSCRLTGRRTRCRTRRR